MYKIIFGWSGALSMYMDIKKMTELVAKTNKKIKKFN